MRERVREGKSVTRSPSSTHSTRSLAPDLPHVRLHFESSAEPLLSCPLDVKKRVVWSGQRTPPRCQCLASPSRLSYLAGSITPARLNSLNPLNTTDEGCDSGTRSKRLITPLSRSNCPEYSPRASSNNTTRIPLDQSIRTSTTRKSWNCHGKGTDESLRGKFTHRGRGEERGTPCSLTLSSIQST